MSAFLCSPRHIAMLAIHAEKPSEMADQLINANIVSVLTRYGEPKQLSVVHAFRGVSEEEYRLDTQHEVTARYQPDDQPITVTDVKLAHSFDYQACEADSWPESLTARFIDDFDRRFIQSLREYEDAPWSI